MPNGHAYDFSPLKRSGISQSQSRPSLSYWQDAWIRLKANTRALISLYLLIGLLIFTLFGPLLWNIDPAAQDLDQISRPPGQDRRALIVPEYSPWIGSASDLEAGSGQGLRLIGEATTQSIRLGWDPMDTMTGYRVYRNIYPIG